VDRVAAAVGMSRPKYHQAKAVVAAAESDPARFGDLPGLMVDLAGAPLAGDRAPVAR